MPCIDFLKHRLYEGRYEVECGTASLEVPLQYIGECVRMKTAVSAHSSLTTTNIVGIISD